MTTCTTTKDMRCLVMDDDLGIRRLIANMLEFLGYEVTSCADGSQAIQCFVRAKLEGSGYQFAILDLVVPNGLGGNDVASRILEVDPDAVLIVSSGNVDNRVMTDPNSHGFSAALAKPYTVKDLSTTLEKLLSGPTARP